MFTARRRGSDAFLLIVKGKSCMLLLFSKELSFLDICEFYYLQMKDCAANPHTPIYPSIESRIYNSGSCKLL